ncbi:MAG: dephospho-CoA kinase [Clostridia bacterium]|nr:dephospho-CoA kinase [Clostridia bacterium]
MKKVYGITGGIGSGKSVVSSIIKGLGYTVFSADEVYTNLLKTGDFSKQIYTLLGLQFNSEKGFNRKEVASVVFNDKNKLKVLNTFTHDKVMAELMRLNANEKGVIFNEVPLLFEGGYQNMYDGVIVVYRNLEDRINAVVNRDNISQEEVLKRIKNQFNYENNDISAHTIIVNDGVYENLVDNVKAVISEIEKSN